MVAFQQHNPQGFQVYEGVEELFLPSAAAAAGSTTHPQALLYNLAVLKEKVQQVQSLVSLVVSPDPIQLDTLTMVVSGARNLIEDISVAASSMMYAFQQLAHGAMPPSSKNEEIHHLHDHMKANYEASTRATDEVLDHVLHGLDGERRGILGAEVLYSNNSISPMVSTEHDRIRTNKEGSDKPGSPLSSSCEIIELDAADLLAKYTHYCQVCGKGFKRDANLRMHMRAHGDEYKTNAALANPMRGGGADGGVAVGQKDASAATSAQRKYSCPQEGCRWNKKHAKFQPLKSMICVKNHYKRSHCPKMYVCNRCNCKQFAVLSDLRTHEKHCGDLKWLCSCGTTFSRKDKLMGHVTLFVGHTPVVNCFTK